MKGLRFLLGAAAIALLAAPIASFPTDGWAQVSVITVTTRRREENLQNVPISVSAFSSAQLEKAAIRNVRDLASFTSNMTFNSGEDGRLNIPVIRGMGMIDTRGWDNNVSIFIDGAYVSGRAGQNPGMLDLQRVEVVKGPQSALYGRNSFAGAINYVSKRPGDEYEGKFEGTAGDDDLYQIQGSFSGPILEDKLFGRIAISYDHDDGTYDNLAGDSLVGGDGFGGHETQSVMGTLRFTPNEMADIVFDILYSDEEVGQRPVNIGGNNCGYLVTTTSFDVGKPYYRCGEIQGARTNELTMSPEAYSAIGDTLKLTLNMEFDVGDYTLTSISSYTDQDSHGNMDLDRGVRDADHYAYVTKAAYDAMTFVIPNLVLPTMFGSFPFLHPTPVPFQADTYLGSQALDQEYWSQEFRIESPQENRFRWSAGAFYFESQNMVNTSFTVDVADALKASKLSVDELVFGLHDPASALGNFFMAHPLLAQPSLIARRPTLTTEIWTDGNVENNGLTSSEEKGRQFSIFGSTEYDITDRLTGTFEFRWTNGRHSLLNLRDDFFFTLLSWSGAPAINKTKHNYFDPRITLNYQVSDDHMVYASASHGTRSGGVNGNLGFGVDPFYDPEKNWTYEIGAKTTWLDGRLQVNAAAFYIDWIDAQFRQIMVSSLGSFLTKTANSEGLEVKGFEFDFAFNPTESVSITGGYGFADAEFADGTLFTGGGAWCGLDTAGTTTIPAMLPMTCTKSPLNGTLYPDMSGAMPKRSSKHTANAAFEYMHEIANSGLDGIFRLDATYRSRQYVDEPNVAFAPDRVVVNLRAGIQTDNYDLTFWVTNLLNDDKPIYAQQFGTNFNSRRMVSSVVNPPLRRFGVTGRFRF